MNPYAPDSQCAALWDVLRRVNRTVSTHQLRRILAALDRAGGEDYLLEQAAANLWAFLSLLGRVLPTQVTGKDDAPLIPDRVRARFDEISALRWCRCATLSWPAEPHLMVARSRPAHPMGGAHAAGTS